MSRSLKKGPYVDERLQKRIIALPAGDKSVLKTWARASTISPEMVGADTDNVPRGTAFSPAAATSASSSSLSTRRQVVA